MYIAWAGRASLAAMDELTIIVLCAALAGIILGSYGTLIVFWCIGYFSSRERGSLGRLNPELEDALIQAGYGRPGASGELPTSIQLTRTQNISVVDPIMASFRLHIGDSGTIYHVDDCCLSYPDSAKKVLSMSSVQQFIFGF